ncbi:hypothetical protein CTAYLR_010135 [Chrysophaeum taylorii]|uniref:Tetratricopeptide repeat n=1 Tax=Chrysophaeum taylorii TaxID=2483200 RepID=A0AAD7UQU2_9STRA|nr:hypothetical protein CTAYLR_010135 [Chrysophaeum taylorii]
MMTCCLKKARWRANLRKDIQEAARRAAPVAIEATADAASRVVPVVGKFVEVVVKLVGKLREIAKASEAIAQDLEWAESIARLLEEKRRVVSVVVEEGVVRRAIVAVRELIEVCEHVTQDGDGFSRKAREVIWHHEFAERMETAHYCVEQVRSVVELETNRVARENAEKLDRILEMLVNSKQSKSAQSVIRSLAIGCRRRRSDDDDDDVVLTAVEQLAGDDNAGARDTIRKASARIRCLTESLVAAGMALYGLEKYDEALESLRAAVAKDGAHAGAWFAIAFSLEKTGGSASDQLAAYEKGLARDSENAIAHYNYANLLRDVRKDYDGAEREFLAAISREPTRSDFRYNYGSLLETAKMDFDGAEREYKAAIHADPNNAKAHNNYGSLLQAVRSDYDGAEREYVEAIRAKPDYAKARANYAILLWTVRQDYDAAEREYVAAICADPNDAIVHASYGLLLEKVRKDYDSAEREYLLAIRADPENGAAREKYHRLKTRRA